MSSTCASVLIRRNLVVEEDRVMVEEVIGRFSGVAGSVASELSRRCLIKEENEAVVVAFIKRTVSRFLLKTSGLSRDDISRILGVNRSVAQRIIKGTLTLTAEHVRKLAA